MRLLPISALILCLSAPVAGAFEIAFTWDGLKLCHDGNARTVKSPAFTLSDVPEGTKFIRFKMVDKDVPGYDHGGGVVAWDGGDTVPAGAFKYKSPCPPGETHRYEWTATAQTKKNGGKLAVAKAARDYPE